MVYGLLQKRKKEEGKSRQKSFPYHDNAIVIDRLSSSYPLSLQRRGDWWKA